MGLANLVGALDLGDDELRIHEDPDPPKPQLKGALQCPDERVIFGNIVGGPAQVSLKLGNGLPMGVRNQGSKSGIPRVAPGGAIGLDEKQWQGL